MVWITHRGGKLKVLEKSEKQLDLIVKFILIAALQEKASDVRSNAFLFG